MKNLMTENQAGFLSSRFEPVKTTDMAELENLLQQVWEDSSGAIRDMCTHILKAGGKRVRPMLVFTCGRILGDACEELISAAVATELIHMASLVHDDVIDHSDLRRSRPSINKTWGTHYAVLCGDYLFARAFGLLSQKTLRKPMKLMTEAIENMCQGEILQADNRFNPYTDLDTYYEIIARKTATFLKNCCIMGGIITGGEEVQVQGLGEYGLHMGYAFQIIDDLLDFCGKQELTGKPRHEDLRQGCLTLPVILLLQKKQYKSWIGEIFTGKQITEDFIQKVSLALQISGDLEQSFERAEYHIECARESLKNLPASEHRDLLFELTETLKSRVN